ncbi:hypothetical protein EB155_08105 [archaeon]|nr:hypothetical protein [archaeon]NDB79817.1 hypothetical protein [archaeon]
MRKLTYKIKTETDSSQTIEIKEFITDRTPEWTEEQYLRNRSNTIMELVSDEVTEEKEAVSREIELG